MCPASNVKVMGVRKNPRAAMQSFKESAAVSRRITSSILRFQLSKRRTGSSSQSLYNISSKPEEPVTRSGGK